MTTHDTTRRPAAAVATADPERRQERPREAGPTAAAPPKPARPVNRVVRHRVRVAAATAVLALVVFLVVSGTQAHQQLGRSSRDFAAARAQERLTLAGLARTEARLAAVLGQSVSTERNLGSVTGQLADERNQLVQQQKNLFVQGVSISALDACLGGVEAALNQVALNDQQGAATTLQGVSSSCQTAGASVG